MIGPISMMSLTESFPRSVPTLLCCLLIISPLICSAVGDNLGSIDQELSLANHQSELSGLQQSSSRRSGNEVALETAVDPETYRPAPGDQLILYIGGSADLLISLVISADGSLIVPSLGVFPATKQTLAKLEESISEQCQQAYGGSQIALTLNRPANLRFPVTGLVAEPGVYESQAAVRLSDLIELAGGLGNGADSRRIQLSRADGSRLACDYLTWLVDSADEGNPILRSGDRIHVPAATSYYRVRGAFPVARSEVAPPNSILDRPFRPQTILVPAQTEDKLDFVLRAAGGLGDNYCSGKISIYSQAGQESSAAEEIQTVSLESAAGKSLRPGDVIEIPFCREWVSVTGAVERPGLYPYLPGQTVIDYILAAGGPNGRGRQSGWSFVDQASGDHQKAKASDSVAAGAMIWVPERRMQKFTSFLTPIVSAAALVVSMIAVTK